MRRVLLILAGCVFLFVLESGAGANPVPPRLLLHWAGPHDSQLNTCDFNVGSCLSVARGGDVMVDAPGGPGIYDVYVFPLYAPGMREVTFELCCDASIDIIDWMSCGDSASTSPGWPGCGEHASVFWEEEQSEAPIAAILVVEVLDDAAQLCLCDGDGVTSICYGTAPDSLCERSFSNDQLGCIGFGVSGYDPCDSTPVEGATWGLIKSLYR